MENWCLWFRLAGWCFTWGSWDNFWASSLSAILIASFLCLRGWGKLLYDSNWDLLSFPVDLFHGGVKIYWRPPSISFAIFHLAAPSFFLSEHVLVPLAYRWWCHPFYLWIGCIHGMNGTKGNHGGFRYFLKFVLPLNISVKFWGLKRVVSVQSK